MREVLFLLRYLTEMVGHVGNAPTQPKHLIYSQVRVFNGIMTQWLRRMDSNHDSLSQSQMSCRWTTPQKLVRSVGLEPT